MSSLRRYFCLILIVIGPAGTGCSGTNRNLLDPHGTISPRIPPLQIHLADIDLLTDDASAPEALRELLKQERLLRAAEARHVINRDLRQNVFAQSGKTSGHIGLRISRTIRLEQWKWALPTAFTLLTINLFGFPANAWITDFHLEARIVDSEGTEVAHYQTEATAKGYLALYWGYAFAAGAQVSHLEAIRLAMESLKQQIQADAARINARLS